MSPGTASRAVPFLVAAISFPAVAHAQATTSATVIVQDHDGGPVAGFRWLVEEDNTPYWLPGIPSTNSTMVNIHSSHAPVVRAGECAASGEQPQGCTPTSVEITGLPAEGTTPDGQTYRKRYFVSVLPRSGHTMGGARLEANGRAVVRVAKTPTPTAQVSVYVFQDDKFINGAPDLPAEAPLEGFRVLVFDAGGQLMTDGYGNPLGTEYRPIDPDLPMGPDNVVVTKKGTGIITTDANGEALIKYLMPGKYGIRVVPPLGTRWVQTSTIEGTPTVDAWVKAGEPPYFAEWGFFQWHAFFGFVLPSEIPPPGPEDKAPRYKIKGQAVYVHQQRPPFQPGLDPGPPVPDCWIGLSDIANNDTQVYAQPCDADSRFEIENVPAGQYILTIWDTPLDAIIDFRTVTVPNPDPESGGDWDLGKVPVYAWFASLTGSVFYDTDEDGEPDRDAQGNPLNNEIGIPGVPVNIRFTDGSMYQTTNTNGKGEFAFREVFPFFFWLATEVDFTRFWPTGARVEVDDGGTIPEGAVRNPQLQPENGMLPYRVETGPVLGQAMMALAGTESRIDWGKAHYADGKNGGISGMVTYETTRAEDDPRKAAAEPWSPGIPRVQVALYRDEVGGGEDGSKPDGIVDDLDGDGGPTYADVDNHPLGWQDGGERGPEDVDRDEDGVFDLGDALAAVHTDSWDDSKPTGCVYDAAHPAGSVHGVPVMDCAETMVSYNQIRPGVYDGAYWFEDAPPGTYIVEVAPPPGYEVQKEQDKNVDFGDEPVLSRLYYPECVGDPNEVPPELDLLPGVESAFAGQTRPLCDRKRIVTADGFNAPVNFFLFTKVPKAARIFGLVLDDTNLEFDPNSPAIGNNLGVAWIPISIQDWTGHEILRTWTDEWGRYEALVPSTFTMNVPAPSGVSPNMLTVCLNHPGPFRSGDRFARDPYYNPSYGQTCTTWDFWPGKTTRLDTPILPIAAFVANKAPVDCETPDGEPVIYAVHGPQPGPYVKKPGSGQTIPITIESAGFVQVPNPHRDPDDTATWVVQRDFGFGSTPGRVFVRYLDNGVLKEADLQVPGGGWTNDAITTRVSSNTPSGHLNVTRGDNGRTTEIGVYLTVGGASSVIRVSEGQSIQAAIDAAPKNALILVLPGAYKENLLMWKAVRLQGAGAASTWIVAGPMSPEEQAAWDEKVRYREENGQVELPDGQRPDFFLERAPGILVATRENAFNGASPRIDGFSITGAIRGGGILVHAYARGLHISNNQIISNYGSFGGGIRVGTPSLIGDGADAYVSSDNRNIRVWENVIRQNGAIDGGGGVAIFKGATGYLVERNFICGNYSFLYGGGVAHFGLSNNGVIRDNRIVSNQSFDEGGGVIVAGELPLPGTLLTEGSGNVAIARNLIHGNLGGDDGGGIRVLMANGQDVADRPNSPGQWYQVAIYGNRITNNVSADAGGGIALDDAARVRIVNNTIAHNDSTSTSPDAFGGLCGIGFPAGIEGCPEGAGGAGFTSSTPQAAGISSRTHSAPLRDAFGPNQVQEFSNPYLHNNIVYQNRSFYWDAGAAADFGQLRPASADGVSPAFWDLHVYGTPSGGAPYRLNPRFCLLTDATGYHSSNVSADPAFADGPGELDGPYFNTFLATAKGAALGNFVMVTFTPTGDHGDYHLTAGSPAAGAGNPNALRANGSAGGAPIPLLVTDIDGDVRSVSAPDMGYDEVGSLPLPPASPSRGAGGSLFNLRMGR